MAIENRKNTEKTREEGPSSARQFDIMRIQSHERDLERGLVDDLSQNIQQMAQLDRSRKTIKDTYADKFGVISKRQIKEQFHAEKDPHREDRANEIVDTWLKNDVLHPYTPEREEKIRTKVVRALEEEPRTTKLIEKGMQLQETRDKQSQTYWGTILTVKERYFGSELSSTKEKISTTLSEERARYAYLLKKSAEAGGEKSSFYKSHKSEITALEKAIEKSNILKRAKANVRADAIMRLESYKESLSASDEQRERKIHKHADNIHAGVMQQLSALEAAHRSELQKNDLQTAQHHTTHGVGLGNLLHLGEMLPGYASLALSALAEKAAAQANSKHD